VVRALDGEGLRVSELNLHAPTLDDVFLMKTGRSLEERPDEPAADGENAPAAEVQASDGQGPGRRSRRPRARR